MPDLTFRVNADVSGLKRGLDQAKSQINSALGSIGGVGGLLTAAGVTTGLERIVADHVTAAKEIAKLAQLANSSVSEASKLLATAAQFGVSSDAISTAIRNVSRSASAEPQLFKDIGVATEDASGKSRGAIDIFNDVRSTLAGANNDYRTTAVAAKILGRSIEEIYPFLRASDEQVQKVTAAAQEMGIVMSTEDVTAALEYAASLHVAQVEGEAIVSQIAGRIIPILGNLAEAAMTAGDMIASLMEAGSGNGAENMISNLGKLRGVIGQALQQSGIGPIGAIGSLLQIGAPTNEELRADPQIKALNDAINKKAALRAAFEKLSMIPPGGGGGFELPDLSGGGGRGRDTVADAMKDHIDAIRAEADAKTAALRDALEGYDRERAKAIETARIVADAWEKERRRNIDAIREEAQAAQKAAQDRVDQIRSAIAEREKQRQHAIAAIRAEMAADDAAFNAREEGRQAERDALNDQLREMDKADKAEKAGADLQAAQDAVAAAQADEPVRVRSESLDEFKARHETWVKDVADAEKHLADVQKAQAKDAARTEIEEKLRAIDEATKADRKATDSRKQAHDDQIALIEQESAKDQEKTDLQIANIEAHSKAQQEAYDAQLKRLQDEADVAKAVSDAKLAEMRNEVAAHDQAVNDEIKALQTQTDETLAELQKQLEMHQRNAANIAAAYPNIERTITYNVVTTGGGGGGSGDLIAAASGMDAIVGPGAGGPQLILAGEGSAREEVHIGPVGSGGGRSGGGREELHIYLDGRELQNVVSRRSYSAYRLGGGKN